MLLLVLCGLTLASAEPVSYQGYELFTVGPFDSTHDAADLYSFLFPPSKSRKVIFWTDPQGALPFDFVVSPDLAGEVQWYLIQNDITHQIHTRDIQSWIDERNARHSPQELEPELIGAEPTSYLDFQQTVTWMNNLASANSRVSVSTFGNSNENRLMYLMTISTGSGTKPGVWMDCGIHAREWISPATCRWIAHKLATGYGSDADSTWLLDNYNFYIAPIINPDGYQYTFDADRLWRKTRTDRGYECRGVDGNRNYATGWGEPDFFDDSCSQTFKGPSAFSEPSQAAVRDKTRELRNTANLKAYLTVHSYTQIWIFPWAHTIDESPHHAELVRVGQLTCNAIEAVNGLWFDPRKVGPSGGLSVDWAHDPQLGLNITYSYLPELRPMTAEEGGFIIDESNIQPSGREIFAGVNAKLRDIVDKVKSR